MVRHVCIFKRQKKKCTFFYFTASPRRFPAFATQVFYSKCTFCISKDKKNAKLSRDQSFKQSSSINCIKNLIFGRRQRTPRKGGSFTKKLYLKKNCSPAYHTPCGCGFRSRARCDFWSCPPPYAVEVFGRAPPHHGFFLP